MSVASRQGAAVPEERATQMTVIAITILITVTVIIVSLTIVLIVALARLLILLIVIIANTDKINAKVMMNN